MLACLRAYNGEYSPSQRQAIEAWGGSDAYARISSVKARTLAAMLHELYLGSDRPWKIEPTPIPTLPDDVNSAVKELVMDEVSNAQGAGEEVLPEAIISRMQMLHGAAMDQARIRADKDAKTATLKLDDILVEGGFNLAMREFLIHFSIYPFAVLKGPVFQMKRRVKYEKGKPQVVEEPIQGFVAPNPFDVWFSPGVSKPADGDVVERLRLSRFALEALRAHPGYDGDAIDAFIAQHPGGHSEWTSNVEQARADMEERESPVLNDSGLYDVLEFHGWMPGHVLDAEPLFDRFKLNDRDTHHVTVRLLGSIVIGAHPNPDPLERSIYHVASFEDVPGSVVGRGLPEALADAQGLANAAMRAVINNMGMSSGPQVGINRASVDDGENVQEMYPWKRWIFTPDPSAPSALPLTFFQPVDNSQALLAALDRAMMYADEVSAIPRFAAGTGASGGAQRTASGLSMLQGNMARVVKFVAKGIDDNVLGSVLQIIYSMTLLTDDTGIFRGDESIKIMGVEHAAQQETDKLRAMELLTVTANPMDMQVLGIPGRALLLTRIAENLGFDRSQLAKIIEANAKQAAQQMAAAQAAPPGGPPGAPPGAPPDGPPGSLPNPPARPGGGGGRVQAPIENQGATARRALPF